MMVLNFLKSSRPSLLIKRAALGNLKATFHCTHWHRFFPLKKAFFYLSVSPARRAPLSPQAPLNSLYDPFGSPCRGQKPQEEGCNRPTRCSEPLRYKVGGPSKVYARLCGMGPPGNNDTMCISLMLIYTSLRKTKTSNKYIVISSLTLLQIQRNLQRSWNHQNAGNTYLHKVRETYCVYLPLSVSGHFRYVKP